MVAFIYEYMSNSYIINGTTSRFIKLTIGNHRIIAWTCNHQIVAGAAAAGPWAFSFVRHSRISIRIEWCFGAFFQQELVRCCQALWPHPVHDERGWKCGTEARGWAACSIPALEISGVLGSWALSFAPFPDTPAPSQAPRVLLQCRQGTWKQRVWSHLAHWLWGSPALVLHLENTSVLWDRKTAKPKRCRVEM